MPPTGLRPELNNAHYIKMWTARLNEKDESPSKKTKIVDEVRCPHELLFLPSTAARRYRLALPPRLPAAEVALQILPAYCLARWSSTLTVAIYALARASPPLLSRSEPALTVSAALLCAQKATAKAKREEREAKAKADREERKKAKDLEISKAKEATKLAKESPKSNRALTEKKDASPKSAASAKKESKAERTARLCKEIFVKYDVDSSGYHTIADTRALGKALGHREIDEALFAGVSTSNLQLLVVSSPFLTDFVWLQLCEDLGVTNPKRGLSLKQFTTIYSDAGFGADLAKDYRRVFGKAPDEAPSP